MLDFEAENEFMKLVSAGMALSDATKHANAYALARQEIADEAELQIKELKDKVELVEKCAARLETEKTALEQDIQRLERENLELGHSISEEDLWCKGFKIAVDYIRMQAKAARFCSVSGLQKRLDAASIALSIPMLNSELVPGSEAPDPEEDQSRARLERKLFEIDAELEKYKAAVIAMRDAAYRGLTPATYIEPINQAIEGLKEKGYDIEHEREHQIPEICDTGSEDNSEGADEHNFL